MAGSPKDSERGDTNVRGHEGGGSEGRQGCPGGIGGKGGRGDGMACTSCNSEPGGVYLCHLGGRASREKTRRWRGDRNSVNGGMPGFMAIVLGFFSGIPLSIWGGWNEEEESAGVSKMWNRPLIKKGEFAGKKEEEGGRALYKNSSLGIPPAFFAVTYLCPLLYRNNSSLILRSELFLEKYHVGDKTTQVVRMIKKCTEGEQEG